MKIKVNASFDIEDIMTCGQAFRYEEVGPKTYQVIAYKKRLKVIQEGNEVTFLCAEEDYTNLWSAYFDMTTNYSEIQQALIAIEPKLEAYILKKPGIRILKQEPFEMMITFILSQNKSMPQIKQLVKRLSEHYGSEVSDELGTYYAFPTVDQLDKVSEETFRALKVGFRAPYLVDAIRRVSQGSLNLETLSGMATGDAREELLKVKGIGRKVADCILLFGYHRMDVFPLDVWMKRAIKTLYFDEAEVSDKLMLAKAEEVFGDLCGIAQQYIFYGTVEGM